METIANYLADGLVYALMSLLDLTFDIMNSGLLGVTSLAEISPDQWMGGRPWRMMEFIQTGAVLPVAAIFLSCLMSMEIISMVQDKNNYHEVELSALFKIIVKMSIAAILVSNSLKIVSGFFQIGIYLISNGAALMPELAEDSGAVVSAEAVMDLLDKEASLTGSAKLSFVMIFIIITILSFLLAFGIQAIAYLTVYARFFEIIIFSVMAPIPMATLMNSKWSDVGTNYIKNMLSYGVQGFMIIFIMGIYSVTLSSISFDMTTIWTFTGSLLMRLIFGLVLAKMLLSSGQITKSIFSAH